jgi:hypothetical protein
MYASNRAQMRAIFLRCAGFPDRVVRMVYVFSLFIKSKHIGIDGLCSRIRCWGSFWDLTVHRSGDDRCYECDRCACARLLGEWRSLLPILKTFAQWTTRCTCWMFSVCVHSKKCYDCYQKQSSSLIYSQQPPTPAGSARGPYSIKQKKEHEDGDNVVRTVTICTRHQILLGRWCEGRWAGRDMGKKRERYRVSVCLGIGNIKTDL